ncbi:MAG: hypothetical protein V3W34_03035 [Phycisphaerae bacterium]
MLHRILVNLLLILLLGGCTSVTHHGDATIHDLPDFPFLVADSLYLPQFSLSNQATHTWKVRNLPLPVFPSEVVVEADYADVPSQAPWQDAVILVEIRSIDGDVLMHQRIEFATWKGGGSYVDGRSEVSFPFRDLPSPTLTNYDVLVTVERPSPRTDDHAWLHGLTKIGG